MEAGTTGTGEPLALDQIQGNIAGFYKPLQSFIALHFDDAAKGRDFVHAVLREVDTCAAVAAFNRRYKWHVKRGKTPPTSEWFNLLFSAKGLEAVEAPELEEFEAVFREGMRARPGAGRLDWHLAVEGDREIAMRAVLASEQLRSLSPGRLRPCANEECSLFLIDRSKNNSARWCSMASCGNRLKARRHHERGRR